VQGKPNVSIIITAYNARQALERILGVISGQRSYLIYRAPNTAARNRGIFEA
jgi:hypothetical protein